MGEKRKVVCTFFSKPTLNEVSIYQENLSKAEEEVCEVSKKMTMNKIRYLGNKCHIWIYIKCANTEEELPIDICKFCKNM